MKNIFAFLLLCLLAACHSRTAPPVEEEADAASRRALVRVVTPQRQTLSDWLDLNATTQYQRKENIRAIATGYLRSFHLQPGDRLKAGVQIGVIVTKEQEALRDLADLPELRGTREPLPLRTGASGVVTALFFQEGDFVSEGEVIATISQPASLALLLNAPYEYQRFVTPGKTCVASLPDGRQLRGRVSKAMPSVDLASQTQTFLVELQGAPALPENLNVIVRISTGQRVDVLCVPLAAIQTDETQQEFWVMKMIGDSMAIKVPVSVGLRSDSVQELHSPQILATDRVVTEGAFGLADTAWVQLREE